MASKKDLAALAMILQNLLKATMIQKGGKHTIPKETVLRAQEDFILDVKEANGTYHVSIVEADDRGGAARMDPKLWTPENN